MTVALATPEILQLINGVIVNAVAVIEQFGIYVFYISIIILVLWIFWSIGRAARELIVKKMWS